MKSVSFWWGLSMTKRYLPADQVTKLFTITCGVFFFFPDSSVQWPFSTKRFISASANSTSAAATGNAQAQWKVGRRDHGICAQFKKFLTTQREAPRARHAFPASTAAYGGRGGVSPAFVGPDGCAASWAKLADSP